MVSYMVRNALVGAARYPSAPAERAAAAAPVRRGTRKSETLAQYPMR